MTMADLVVVMGNNRVQQVGPPLEVYRRPFNRFVADFIGSNNFLPATVVGANSVTVFGQTFPARVPNGAVGDVTLSVRPEDLRLHAKQPAGPAIEGRVSFVRDLGRTVETFVRVNDTELSVLGAEPQAEGTAVWLEIPPGAGVVLSQ